MPHNKSSFFFFWIHRSELLVFQNTAGHFPSLGPFPWHLELLWALPCHPCDIEWFCCLIHLSLFLRSLFLMKSYHSNSLHFQGCGSSKSYPKSKRQSQLQMTSQSPTVRGSRRGFTNQSLGLAHPTDWMPFWDTRKPPIANLFHITFFGVCFHPSFYKTVKVTRCLFKVMCTVNQWLISTFQGHPHLLHPSRTFIVSEGQKLKEHRCGTVWF